MTGFVARREQLELLDAALRDVEAGEPRLVVFGGDAGIGKTRLIGQFADRVADAGVRVLRTGCIELGVEGLPLAPVNDALRQLVALVGADELTAMGAGALLRLLPEYGDEPSRPDARVLDLFGAVLQRLGTEHPLVWLVDDLHWADRTTLDLLGLLARTLRATRVLIVIAYRTDDPATGEPFRSFLAELSRLPSVRRSEVRPFNRAETAELLGADDVLVDRVFRASGGNALYAVELARAEPGPGLPATLRDLLLARTARLPEPARQVLRYAAVGGPAVSHRLLAALAGMPEPELMAGLRAATGQQVLVPMGDGYAFRHGLLRDAVLSELLPAERIGMHRAAAEALTADPDLVPADRAAAVLAHHWLAAGDSRRALPALLDAASYAASVSAHAGQAQLLDRALRIWPPDEEQDRMAVFGSAIAAATWSGDDLRAIDLVDRALELGAGEQAAMLLASRAMALHNLGRDGALVAVDEALAVLPPAGSVERARVLDFLASVLVLRGRAGRARDAAAEALEIAVAAGATEVEASAGSTLGWALCLTGDYREALTRLYAAKALAEQAADQWQLARAHLNLAKAHAGLGEYDAAIETATAGLELCRANGVERTLGGVLYIYLISSLHAIGRWDEALAATDRALDLDPPATSATAYYAVRARIAAARGNLAAEDLSAARAVMAPVPDEAPWTLDVIHAEAELARHQNRVDDAQRLVADALPVSADRAAPSMTWALLCTAPDPATVQSYADGLRTDTPVLAAYAAQFAAELGTRPWSEAVEAWTAVGQVYAAARAGVRAASEHLSAGARPEAVACLETSYKIATDLGAVPLAEEIAVLARGAHLPDPSGSGVSERADSFGLTDREAEVLALVAAGHSNKQIAERLYISPKTVSVHVSNLLAKLGVSTRGEAAATAHRLNLLRG